jgi:hypothetical protein
MASREHSLRAQLASEHRKRDRDPERITTLRRELAAEQIAGHVRRILGGAPPLTDDQRQELATLVLQGGAGAAA